MTVIALIDADNFYVSVERIFRADLRGKPVVVLSSNDANVIARSKHSHLILYIYVQYPLQKTLLQSNSAKMRKNEEEVLQ